MGDEKQNEYDICMNTIREVIDRWEKMCPEEELVVMVLPKYDEQLRKERLGYIYEMLLGEQWFS